MRRGPQDPDARNGPGDQPLRSPTLHMALTMDLVDEGDEDVVDKGETELSNQEVKDLDQLTGNVVNLLNT